MVENVITNLDSSKASGPECISEVVLKNCETEHSYILAELFNMSLGFKMVSSLGFRKVSLVILVFKNGESSTAKNYHPVTFSMVSHC